MVQVFGRVNRFRDKSILRLSMAFVIPFGVMLPAVCRRSVADELRVEDRSGLIRLFAKMNGSAVFQISGAGIDRCCSLNGSKDDSNGSECLPAVGRVNSPLPPVRGIMLPNNVVEFRGLSPGRWVLECDSREHLKFTLIEVLSSPQDSTD